MAAERAQKSYDVLLAGAESGIVRRYDATGQHPMFTDALRALVVHLGAESGQAIDQGNHEKLRPLIDRLTWLALSHPNLAAYNPDGGDFRQSEELMAKRARPWKGNPRRHDPRRNPHANDGDPGYVGRIDAFGRFELMEGPGWAYAKDAKAQSAAALRELALIAENPELANQAVRSLAFIASGSLTDFIPAHWNQSLVAWVNSETNRPFGPLATEVIPGGPSALDIAAIVCSAHQRDGCIATPPPSAP